MAQAKELIETFWELQDGHDYCKLISLFADDAVFEDPAIGRVEGIEAISALLHHLTKELTSYRDCYAVPES